MDAEWFRSCKFSEPRTDIYNQTRNKGQIREQLRLLAEQRLRNDKTPREGINRVNFSSMSLPDTGEVYKACSNNDKGDIFMTTISTEFSCVPSHSQIQRIPDLPPCHDVSREFPVVGKFLFFPPTAVRLK